MKLLLIFSSAQCAACFLTIHDRVSSSVSLPFTSFGSNTKTPTPIIAKSSSTCTQQGSEDGEKDGNILVRAYRKYADLSERRPYPTKSLSAGVIVGAGAILSQWIQAMSGGIPLVLNWHQVRSFALTGLLFEGPYLHWWYDQLFKLGRYLLESTGLSSRAMTLTQIAIDETIGVIIFFPTYFFAFEMAQSLLLLRGTICGNAACFGRIDTT